MSKIFFCKCNDKLNTNSLQVYLSHVLNHAYNNIPYECVCGVQINCRATHYNHLNKKHPDWKEEKNKRKRSKVSTTVIEIASDSEFPEDTIEEESILTHDLNPESVKVITSLLRFKNHKKKWNNKTFNQFVVEFIDLFSFISNIQSKDKIFDEIKDVFDDQRRVENFVSNISGYIEPIQRDLEMGPVCFIPLEKTLQLLCDNEMVYKEMFTKKSMIF